MLYHFRIKNKGLQYLAAVWENQLPPNVLVRYKETPIANVFWCKGPFRDSRPNPIFFYVQEKGGSTSQKGTYYTKYNNLQDFRL